MDKKSFGMNFDVSKRSMNFKDISNKYKKKYNQSIILDIEGEVWKPIKNYENLYAISNKGRVKNIISNSLMSIFKVGNYLKVSLESKQYYLHKIIAEAFIPNPENKPHVDHIDTNSLNNDIDNLRWCTTKENNNNPLTIAKQVDRLKSYNVERKLEVVRFKENDIYNIDIYESVLSAANSVNDKSTNISKRCKNNSGLDNPKYKAKGYIFMYKTDYDNFINKHNECT